MIEFCAIQRTEHEWGRSSEKSMSRHVNIFPLEVRAWVVTLYDTNLVRGSMGLSDSGQGYTAGFVSSLSAEWYG